MFSVEDLAADLEYQTPVVFTTPVLKGLDEHRLAVIRSLLTNKNIPQKEYSADIEIDVFTLRGLEECRHFQELSSLMKHEMYSLELVHCEAADFHRDWDGCFISMVMATRHQNVHSNDPYVMEFTSENFDENVGPLNPVTSSVELIPGSILIFNPGAVGHRAYPKFKNSDSRLMLMQLDIRMPETQQVIKKIHDYINGAWNVHREYSAQAA